jgi:cytochrome c peroxidase/cytochrome oxidase Cu insertion factor (SCO1/SenC/PrrC family)
MTGAPIGSGFYGRRQAAGVLLVLVLILAGWPSEPAAAAPSGPRGVETLPNVPLITHQGKGVRFYQDLLKGKVVLIHFLFTQCRDVCPLITARLAQVQKLLGARVGRDIFLYSITVDPQHDTPAVLRQFMQAFRVGPGWTFLTGKREDIILLRQELGVPTLIGQQELADHVPTLIVADGVSGRWMHQASSASPQAIATLLTSFQPHKTPPISVAAAASDAMQGRATPRRAESGPTEDETPVVPPSYSDPSAFALAGQDTAPPPERSRQHYADSPHTFEDVPFHDSAAPFAGNPADGDHNGGSTGSGGFSTPGSGGGSFGGGGFGLAPSAASPAGAPRGIAPSPASVAPQMIAPAPDPTPSLTPTPVTPLAPQPVSPMGSLVATSPATGPPSGPAVGTAPAAAPPPPLPIPPTPAHRRAIGRTRLGRLLLDEIGPQASPGARTPGQERGPRDPRIGAGGGPAGQSGQRADGRGPILSRLDPLTPLSFTTPPPMATTPVIVSVGDSGSLRTTALLQHLKSLKTVSVPDPPDFATYVRDRRALQLLGKALFWDQQLGSDGQACASCHFHAGADNRSLHQLNPGFRNTTPGVDTNLFSTELGFGPNYQLKPTDFPLHKLENPDDRTSVVISDTHNVVSSQGVFNVDFTATGTAGDQGIPNLTGTGHVFSVGGAILVRNVEPRNTPSTINAALNHRNFWDGRARSEYNATSPIGLLDPTTQIVRVGPGGTAALVQVQIENSSAASQANGPALSNLEMSFNGRQFPQLGRKMLAADLIPLGQQVAAPEDSLLGLVSRYPARGLRTAYADLVRQAFQPAWWDAPGQVVDMSGPTPVITAGRPGPARYSVMEYNFSLFFGLAVQEYEKLLLSNDTPFDRFMEGDLGALTAQQQEGLAVFLGRGKCIACHGGPEFTNAGVTNFERLQTLERMVVGNFQTVQDINEGAQPDPVGYHLAVYDNGFYNIGVRPSAEDLGVGARIGPNNLPLANSRRFLEQVQDRVAALRAQNPTLDLDGAVALANQQLGVPRILARPGEAYNLLQRAAVLMGNPAEVTALLDQANAILIVAGDDAALMGAVIDAALADAGCGGALGCMPAPIQVPTDVPTNMTGASQLLVWARDLLAARVPGTAGANAVIELMSLATMLLPDPFDPGPDPLRPLGPPLYPDELANVDGALKVPSLRNVALTAPYFHNGGQATLEQVVAFYNRGGDFALANQDNLDPNVHPLLLTGPEREALVAFLHALTDERVRYEKAPFDRPSLNIPNGGSGHIIDFFGVPAMDDRIEIPAVGAAGNGMGLGTPGTPLRNFLDP